MHGKSKVLKKGGLSRVCGFCKNGFIEVLSKDRSRIEKHSCWYCNHGDFETTQKRILGG